MKIHQLEIENFRGIRYVAIAFDGKNHLVVGANGVGKSSIVDAIDFLISGRVNRLSGESYGSVRPNLHYAYLGTPPEKVKVRALISFDDGATTFRVERCLATATELSGEGLTVDQILRIERTAALRQHIITRKDMLRFIAVQPRRRAELIQGLLDWSTVEDRRQRLVTVENSARIAMRADDKAVKAEEKGIALRLGIRPYKAGLAHDAINAKRALVGLHAIAVLASTTIADEVSHIDIPPDVARAHDFVRQHERVLDTIGAAINVAIPLLQSIDAALADLPPNPAELVSLHNLLELGIRELGDATKCPLCDTPWNPDSLRGVLTDRLAKVASVAGARRDIERWAGAGQTAIAELREMLTNAAALAAANQLSTEASVVQQTIKALDSVWIVDVGMRQRRTGEEFAATLRAPRLHDSLSRIFAAVRAGFGTDSERDQGRVELLALAARFELLEEKREIASHSAERYEHAARLLELYLVARDHVVGSIYGAITGRFDELYVALHRSHAANFSSKLTPDGPGLDFLVDFYDSQAYAPQVVHSEGHQDSMGLCLFFALGEHLTKGSSTLLIIDDVVTSIDVDHRRALAELFAQQLPNRQLIVTTHDAVWAEQLKNLGVVDRTTGVTLIQDWTFESGLVLGDTSDLWSRIERSLDEKDVAGAAALLRRALEQFFALQCDGLGTAVRYTFDGRLTLSDWMPPALNDLKSTLKRAKALADRQSRTDDAAWLQGRLEAISSAEQGARVEEWLVNPTMHFDPLINTSPADFRPVAAADRALLTALLCPGCNAPFRKPNRSGAIACRCRALPYK